MPLSVAVEVVAGVAVESLFAVGEIPGAGLAVGRESQVGQRGGGIGLSEELACLVEGEFVVGGLHHVVELGEAQAFDAPAEGEKIDLGGVAGCEVGGGGE